MPAVQSQTNNVGGVDGGRVDGGAASGGADPAPAGSPSVHDYLEMALEAAGEQEMSTSELMGIFFYYAHSIAESYRQDVLDQTAEPTP